MVNFSCNKQLNLCYLDHERNKEKNRGKESEQRTSERGGSHNWDETPSVRFKDEPLTPYFKVKDTPSR